MPTQMPVRPVFQLNRGILHSTVNPAYLCVRIFIKAAVRGFRTDDTEDG
jgi:hypothetical protein